MRVNYSFDLFKEVEIDNQVITQYQAESGSTVINLENAYLDSLSEGSHTIKVIFHDSKSAEGSFEVKASKPDPDPVDPVDPVDPADPKDPNKPTDIDTGTPIAKTSDNTGQLLVLVIATLLGAGVVLLAWRKLRQCSKK